MKTVNSIMKYEKRDGDLYKSYKEACNNEKFKQLIDVLNIDDKILMKYTSSLEESSNEYNNCLHCKSILSCKNKVCGYAYLPKVNNKILSFDYVACKKKKKLDKESSFSKNVYLYDLPADIKCASFENIYVEYKERFEVIKWLKEFIKQYDKNKNQKGLYLHGNFGCGKTYLVAATFNELAKKGYKSAIVFWPEFLRDLKTSFQSDFKEKYDKIKKTPLLLIDDIGAENTTSWGRDEILCPLLQYRMEEGLTTFFTSNLDIKNLEEHFEITKDGFQEMKSKRLIERVKQLTIDIEMISNNLRK